jgi:DNA polymerase III delta prime subunit
MNTRIYGHTKQRAYLTKLLTSHRIPQTMLFTGMRGIGKKILARNFFSSVFCEQGREPCGTCKACLQIAHQTFPDFIEIEPNEKGSIPIGNEKEPGTIRWLIKRLQQQPVTGKYTVIINNIETISEAGQNALLKTIEEPGQNSYIILTATARALILPTILSRCTEIKLQPLTTEHIMKIIAADEVVDNRLSFIALISGGSAEIALSLKNEEILNEFLVLCKTISQNLLHNRPFAYNIQELQKKIMPSNCIDILINIYAEMLRIIARKSNDYNALFDTFFIDDRELLGALIRILLVIKRVELHNVNLNNTLKGLLYSCKKQETNMY